MTWTFIKVELHLGIQILSSEYIVLANKDVTCTNFRTLDIIMHTNILQIV